MRSARCFGPLVRQGRTEFRLWAPGIDAPSVDVNGIGLVPMQADGEGFWSASAECGAGSSYRFRLADGALVPDPASHSQPLDVHGPSVVVDHDSFAWQTSDWRGRPWHETVIYELHPGIMGGFRGITDALPALAELGITAVELMPTAEFSGSRNWGYDGVLPFAPESAYGAPDGLKTMIDTAHGLGLMVFLDVVYNHFGPDGNWLPSYAPEFFRDDLKTPWGSAIDFRKSPVRRFFIENALYWLGDYRFDGLRLDAVHAISEADWLDEMASEVRAAFPDRRIHLMLENEHNTASHLRGPFDAQWNDDFHNVMHVLLTGETSFYYSAFADQPIERLARALGEGFIYQGDPSPHHHGAVRGSPSGDLPPAAFVNFLQNHDQIGNRALGERLTILASPDALKSATALLLLAPNIPLIFMGDEIGAQSPFLFFTDFHDALADAVREGRRREFAGFPAFSSAEGRKSIPDPNDIATFHASAVTAQEGEAAQWRGLYRRLLQIRHQHVIPRLDGARSIGADVIAEKAVWARWRMNDGQILSIAMNLGEEAVAVHRPHAMALWGDARRDEVPPMTTLAWLG